ncbi:MAG: hypothetical protein LBF62_09510 [Tannerellaceae bacterium]|jgi:hypothetical protein|nr:hypothetical protein [Tannerellaceae bacterium]
MTVSNKSTKTEILDAYENLLKKVQAGKSETPKVVQEENKKKEALEKVSELNDDKIEKEILDLKTDISHSLDGLLKNMRNEFRKLEEIRAAIAIEKKSLEDLYSLSANTDSLAAMLLAQKERKECFEKEMEDKQGAFNSDMAAKKEQWEAEKTKQKLAEKEYLDDLTKRRKREEDEYNYTRKIVRQKEQDEYDVRKASLEKELTDRKAGFEQDISKREAEIKNAEAELAELKKNNAEFPGKLEKALENKEKEITTALQTKYDFDIKLIENQYKADIRLKDQIISSLQEKIKELNIQLKDYSEKATRAEAGVKEIAVKAIENANKIHLSSKPTVE